MVDKLEAGKTYRLIDKEGYFWAHHRNEGFFHKYFTDSKVKIDKLSTDGYGMVAGCNLFTIITDDEYKYFELVEEEENNMKYPLGKPDYSSDWFLPIKDDAEYVVVKTVLERLGAEFLSDEATLDGANGITTSCIGVCRFIRGDEGEQVTFLEAIQQLFPQKSKQDLQKEELNASIKQMEAEIAKMKQQLENK